ncbi:hypothetical protein BH24ACT26_BH24ACT26_21880 [soil metagenome]
MRARGQLILAAAGVVVVLLVVFLMLIKPRQSALGEVRAQVQTEQDRTQQLQTEVDRLQALQRNAPQLEATLARIRELVPRNNDVANFIFEVQNAAARAGVGFVQITPELPEQPPEGAPLAEVRATIGAKGGYFAVQDFVRRLYDLDRAVRIDTVTMTGVEDDQQAAEDGRIDVVMAARVFFELPEGVAAASATTPAPEPAP